MTRYLLFIMISGAGLGGVFYFYQKSENILYSNHKEVLDYFSSAKQTETSLEKEILLLKNFMATNYDSLIASTSSVEQSCSQEKIAGVFSEINKEIQDVLVRYCDLQEKKLEHIENFKSKNAIYRNSIFYLNTKAETLSKIRRKISLFSDAVRKLTYSSLLYSSLPSVEKKLLMEDRLRSLKSMKLESSQKKEISDLSLHINTALTVKMDLDKIVEVILNSHSTALLDEARSLYFREFNNEIEKANTSRIFLLGSCLLFFICMVLSILGLWKSAKALAYANEHLEDRVRSRTSELMEAQKIMTSQQEALVSSSKLSALGEMAGGVAHEINTPLAVIQIYTDQLTEAVREKRIETDFFLEALTAIDGTVKRISKIISGLRSFARDGRKDKMESVSLMEIVRDSLGLCQERFKNHGIQVEVRGDSEPEILCRMTEVSQVLVNLLNNSFDAISLQPEKWIVIEVGSNDKEAWLSVTDSGTGIPQELHQKIMQPFFTTKEIGKGTGLGLSISRGIVESHGGLLSIDSQCSNTKFIISFPKYLLFQAA